MSTDHASAVQWLRDCHFKVFNEMESQRYHSRAWNRLYKALGTIERAIRHLGGDLHSSLPY